MKKEIITIIKNEAKSLATNHSKEFVELYLEMMEFFNDYFKKQAEEYIESLENYPELKLEKMSDSDLEEYKKLLKKAFLLGQQETNDEILLDLIRIGSADDNSIKVSNQHSLDYAEEYAGTSMSGIDETTQKSINSIITNGIKTSLTLQEIASEINNKFSDYSLYRSSLIAQMEVSTAFGEGQRAQYEQYTEELGIIGYKCSHTQEDSAVRPSHQANADAGRIRRDQVYPGTGTMNAPHDFNCRCSDEYSLTNPETGLLFDVPLVYSEEQIQNFNNNWLVDSPLSITQKELQAQYKLTSEEIKSIQGYTGNMHNNINKGYRTGSSDQIFQSGIQFFTNAVNKLPKYEGELYRGMGVTKNIFSNYAKLKVGDIYNEKSFLSTSLNLKTAKEYLDGEYNILYQFKTSKGIVIKDFSLNPPTEEVLFIPKTLFKVEKTEINDNILTITLTDL